MLLYCLFFHWACLCQWKLAQIYERIGGVEQRATFKQRRAATLVVIGQPAHLDLMRYICQLLIEEREAAHVWLMTAPVTAFLATYPFLTEVHRNESVSPLHSLVSKHKINQLLMGAW